MVELPEQGKGAVKEIGGAPGKKCLRCVQCGQRSCKPIRHAERKPGDEAAGGGGNAGERL